MIAIQQDIVFNGPLGRLAIGGENGGKNLTLATQQVSTFPQEED